jgi:hypothetical protein
MCSWFFHVLVGDKIRAVGPPMICKLCKHPNHRLRECPVDRCECGKASDRASDRATESGSELSNELPRISD